MVYTLSYSNEAQGFPSFYSYNPDWMIGMNNYFYTFKGGNIYRHNVNETRNTFYQPWWTDVGNPNGAYNPSTLQSVINTAPLENKLFKTLNIEGDAAWEAQLETDLQYSGFIQADWFERKEAAYFAFIRNNTVGQLDLRSVNGIGNSLTVTGGDTVNFSISPLISIGSIISVGDYVYFDSALLNFAGSVLSINVNYPAGINQIVIDTSLPGTVPITGDVNYFLYIKNSVAESHGVLGHYCTFNIQNYSTDKIELFAVQSEVMKSFP